MIEWKSIPEYEDVYEVSNTGQVRSLYRRYYNEVRILKQSTNNKGYKLVCLCRKGKQKSLLVHRLVATAFVPNPDNLPCVNHKDQNKQNNNASNLEWCSYYKNNVYGDRLTRSAAKRSIPVRCVETGIVYQSAYAAQRITGFQQSKICDCCRGNRNVTGGFHWEYA